MKRRKEYYSLSEMGEIVDLKTRQLKYRMVKVKEKYKNNKKLLWKGKKQWNIHWTLRFEFDRVKISRIEKDRQFMSLVTINPHGNYDIAYNKELLKTAFNEISTSAPTKVSIKYFIEQGELTNQYHTHFLINLSPEYRNLIRRAANIYTKTNTDVRYIYEEHQLVDYLEKDIKEQGYLSEED